MNRTLLLVFAVSVISCKNKEAANFKVDGTIKNGNAKTVYLEEDPNNSSPIIVDSAQLKQDGSFELATVSKGESLYSLRLDKQQFPFALLINDTKKLTVNADLANKKQPYTVEGSQASKALVDYDAYNEKQSETIYNLARQTDSLNKIKGSDSLTKVLFSSYLNAGNELKDYTTEFINKSTSPILVLYALGSYQSRAKELGLQGYSESEVKDIVNTSSTKFPNSTAIANLKDQLKPRQAPDFTLPDVNGKPVSLSSFRGKYVLVDFWASWCGPCREENPNVVAAYNQFKNKNFTILGVSLDQSKDAWLKAIKDDKLEWTQVSDLKFWNNAAANLYNVQEIPYNVLVDPSGKIIGESLRGADLERKLGEVLK